MPKTKVEVYDKDQLIYPFIESDHVTFSNGMKVSEMLDQSISMPTVTHEDLSFKVGVGDQDVSSAIVDSSVAEMTIKGKTYQNILPEPSTHVLTNNKEMFKVNEGLDPNVEIVDGVSKSAILSGQTLVNIRGKAVDTQANLIDYEVYGLQNNTTYTIVVESTDTNVISVVGFLKDTGNWNCQAAPRTQNCKVVLTTTSAELMGIVRVRKDNKQDTSQAIQIRVMVLKGDYSNVDIPHFEGMQSVKMPVLTTVGKNLWKRGDLNNFDTMFIDEIIPEGTYYFSGEQTTTYDAPVAIALRDSKNNVLGNTSLGGKITINKKASQIAIYSNGHNYANSAGKFLSVNNFMMEKGSAATLYEPYKSNILSTPEEVVLRSVENAQDTINLNIGEYVQRIGEVILNGSEPWEVLDNNTENTIGFTLRNVLPLKKTGDKYVEVNCDKLPSYKENLWNNDKIGCVAENNINQDLNDTQLQVRVLKSTLSTQDTNGFKSWLQTNPLKIQYILETPVVETVDLSSSGNWEKVVLDGSENEVWHNGDPSWANKIFRLDGARHTPNIMNSANALVKTGLLFSSHFEEKEMNNLCNLKPQPKGVSIYGDSIFVGSPQISTIGELRTWLSQNPITVWYQTTNHKDSTQVKQPIFFKDGHIIQSSGTNNSLIPTLDYQAKTSNSYVMDLMKTNTKYTMKAKTASGTFTIDGTSYGAGTNGTFTTPSSMTNKFLVMSNKTNEEVIILEGDMREKDIPYFKGIKSAFEDEDKIEVLSTGKNLYPYGDSTYIPEHSGWYFINGDRQTLWGEKVHKDCGQGAWFYLDEGRYYFSVVNNNNVQRLQVVGDKEKLYGDDKLIPSGWYTLRMSVKNANEEVNITNIMVEKDTKTTYESRKSNITKIPLSSPLRSLPNGVCDELIIDRTKKKATLIQRVGHVVFSSNLGHNTEQDSLKTSLFTSPTIYSQASGVRICDRFLNDENSNLMLDSMQAKTESEGLGSWSAKENFNIRILVSRLGGVPSTSAMTNWLKENPVTILYHLKTPIITEVDLEGFPYIYKDGYIFLNSEIVPTTEIIYSVNQCQQISASNEDIIRHEKELTYLQKLIAQYVQVDYESVLLSLKV